MGYRGFCELYNVEELREMAQTKKYFLRIAFQQLDTETNVTELLNVIARIDYYKEQLETILYTINMR